jgi:two-component system OmpR family response regulator
MPLRVLVVDDEESIGRALELLLQRAGYAVEVVRTGAAAEALLALRRVDCLVLDYRIPDVRGDELYVYAAAVQPHLRGRAVFMTGDIHEHVHTTLDETGCVRMEKPFDVHAMLEAIERLTAGIRQQDAAG